MGGDTTNMHYWEYNSRSVTDGKPVDVSQRKPESKQLTMERDAATIANYSNPAYVLGWNPTMAPIILKDPEPAATRGRQTATLSVTAAAVPDPSYQWFRNDKPVRGAVGKTLEVRDAGRYSVSVTNAAGTVRSKAVAVTVGQ
jgi:hypothetical protein